MRELLYTALSDSLRCSWRSRGGSNAQGFYTRLFSKEFPSPAVGLLLQVSTCYPSMPADGSHSLPSGYGTGPVGGRQVQLGGDHLNPSRSSGPDKMVDVTGFEPASSRSQSERSPRLNHTSIIGGEPRNRTLRGFKPATVFKTDLTASWGTLHKNRPYRALLSW